MTEQEMRMHRCCFTGNRPQKLAANQTETECKKWLANAIEKLHLLGYKTFITGMALGIDQWAAECVIEFRKTHDDVHLIAAVPFAGQERRWTYDQQKKYHEILNQCDLVKIICSGGYSAEKMELRNRWMVDHSAIVIGIRNPTVNTGGTVNCIRYAIEQIGVDHVCVATCLDIELI